MATVLRPNLDHWQERSDLAAAFRWTARLNMHEGVSNHFSFAVDDRHFLINPRNRHFSRVKASELVLCDAYDDATLERPDAPERTAWCLHGALHRNLSHARCVLHVHSKYATVLSCLQDSRLPPIDQNAMRFFERLAIDEGYDGMGLDDEAERVSSTFGDKPHLIMGNHGIMVTAPTIALAFDELYYLERAAETYVTALATGRPLRLASDEVARKTAAQWLEDTEQPENHLRELRAILDDEGSDYRD
ncbi:MAG: class II aldolase and adducin N-terminal domain-containing protein [Pseudomonadota bacterium]